MPVETFLSQLIYIMLQARSQNSFDGRLRVIRQKFSQVEANIPDTGLAPASPDPAIYRRDLLRLGDASIAKKIGPM